MFQVKINQKKRKKKPRVHNYIYRSVPLSALESVKTKKTKTKKIILNSSKINFGQKEKKSV